MAEEYDSDLEGKDESVIIHDETTNNQQTSKKRSFHEMEDNDNDNNYSAKHSNKKPKLDHPSNDDIDAFLNDSDDDDEDSDLDEQEEDITIDKESMLYQEVEFELKDIHDLYYHEVKDILAATEWDQKKLNVVQLTDTIIKQEEIGGVLLSENSVLGFITLLSFKKYLLSINYNLFMENSVFFLRLFAEYSNFNNCS